MYLNSVSLTNVCLDVFLHGFILCGTVLASWTLVTVSFPMLGKFFTIFSSNIFSRPPFFFSFSVPSIIQMFVYLMLSQQSLRLSWFVSITFLYSSPQWSFPPLHLPVHSSILLPYVFCHWFLVSVIFISAIILFIYVCLFV